MPQIPVNSGTITNFGWSANFDILNRRITFSLLPFTTGQNLANRPVAFSVVDSDGVTLASINFATPQIPNAGTTTSWVLDLSSVNFPFLFQTYAMYAAIQDVGGQVYQTNVVYPTICQPNNLTDSGYVPGLFQIIPDCINSVLTVKEITQLVYNSLAPFGVPTKTGVLSYPTGTISAVNFSNTPFSNNVIYTGQYNIACTTVATYAIGGDVYVLVSYVTNNVFPVTCANKLADVACCITKVQQTALKNCNNAIGDNAKQQLADISTYVLSALIKEGSGQDSQFEVDYIRKFLSCDCGSTSLSQSEFTPINPAVTSIVLQGVGGTTIPAPTVTGNTNTYNIASNVYQVTKGNIADLAFTIQQDTSVSNTVKYIITFNYDTMAGYILTAIANDPTLLAQLNSLITATGGSLIGLNGACIIDLTKTNYSLSQAITNSTLVTNIVINGNNFAAPANLFANNPTAVAAWLNSLALGVFSAAVNSGILTILSNNNTNTISTLTFSSPNVTQQFQATNATLVQVLQAIINYLCSLTDLQIALNAALSVCTLDYNNNVVTTNYPIGTKQSAYNAALSNAICNLSARINTLTGLTCAKLQSIFSDNPNVSFSYANDRFLSIVGGSCTTLNAKQAALALISAVNADSTTKAAFCAISCVTPGTCPDISSINLSMSGPNIAIFGLTWIAPNPTASQTVTVKYRVTGTTMWNVATNSLVISPAGTIQGTTPFLITSGIAAGVTYDIQIVNNCGGVGNITQITTPTSPVFNGNFILGSVIYSICSGSPVTLHSSSPFATGVTMFTDIGLTTPVTGNLLIVNLTTNHIFNINSGTGVVGSDTGSVCTSGTPGNYMLGNNPATVCSAATTILYTNGAFNVGQILYIDSALTTPQTGFSFVVQSSTGTIYNMNSVTGAVGSATGFNCSVLVGIANELDGTIAGETGIVGFTSAPVPPGSDITGTHTGFTGSIGITFSVGSSFNNTHLYLTVNSILVQTVGPIAAGSTAPQSFLSRTFAPTDAILIQWTN